MIIELISQGLNSIKNRGLIQTGQVLLSLFFDLFFDIKYGTDTFGVVK